MTGNPGDAIQACAGGNRTSTPNPRPFNPGAMAFGDFAHDRKAEAAAIAAIALHAEKTFAQSRPKLFRHAAAIVADRQHHTAIGAGSQ